MVLATVLAVGDTAYACWWGGTFYDPLIKPYLFAGQSSQGGNYYYGLIGTMYTTFPPDPRDAEHPTEHVNAFLMSVDATSNGQSCCWSSTGWFVGYNIVSPRSSATTYAELADNVTPIVFTVGDPAPASTWYQVIQNGQLPSGRYRYDAYWYYNGVWKWGGYAELVPAATRQDTYAESTNPSDEPPGVKATCRRNSASGAGDNRMENLQLFVGGIGWQYWRPSPEGRWADIYVDAPYHRTPITNYTAQGVGGP
jgi:hypothetical protein